MAAGSTFVRVFFTEDDVPGAKFCYNSVEEPAAQVVGVSRAADGGPVCKQTRPANWN